MLNLLHQSFIHLPSCPFPSHPLIWCCASVSGHLVTAKHTVTAMARGIIVGLRQHDPSLNEVMHFACWHSSDEVINNKLSLIYLFFGDCILSSSEVLTVSLKVALLGSSYTTKLSHY